jgi:hypothetical protein
LPGVPASIQAFMSASVQPGGNLNSGVAAGFVSTAGSAAVAEPANIKPPTTTTGKIRVMLLIKTSVNKTPQRL